MSDEILWVAHYTNGTSLKQHRTGEDGPTYKNIRRDQLVAFDLWQGDRLLVRVDMRQDSDNPELGPKRLIWRIRHQQNSKGGHQRIHMAGWKRLVTIGEKQVSVQSIAYVFEDGVVLMGGQWRDEAYFHAIKPLEFETDLVT